MESKHLREAIRLWAGWDVSPMPLRNEQRVMEHFGDDYGQYLMKEIMILEADFYESSAHIFASSLVEMSELASKEFVAKHPKADKEIVEVLAWCYTFDFK
jgi:hypothetical protein